VVRSDRPNGTRTLIIGGGVIALLGAGWYLLSRFVMHTAASDALGESLGVVFSLLVVVSIAGSIASGRGNPG
jgi:hypothetical protein